MIITIVAVSNNFIIGKDNKLLWHLPDDFKRFKELTSDCNVIMGRKTFESLPKPLPNRKNIIITRNIDYIVPDGCIVVSSLEDALEVESISEDTYIIGGGEIYKQSMDIIDKLEITLVNKHIDGDTYFGDIDLDKWKLVSNVYHPIDDKHNIDFNFLTYIRR